MKVQQKEVSGAAVLELKGKLTGGPEAETFKTLIKSLVDQDKKYIIIDLKRVDWINSTGLGILISNYTTIKQAGGDLVLCNVGDRIDSILYVTKLNLLFQVFDSLDEAAGYLRKTREGG